MLKIVGKFLVELRNMLTDKNVKCEISDSALDHLVDNGFDSKMGARPMQRYIDKNIKRPLSKLLLFGDLKDGGTVKIDVEKDQIKLIPLEIPVPNAFEKASLAANLLAKQFDEFFVSLHFFISSILNNLFKALFLLNIFLILSVLTISAPIPYIFIIL